MTENASILQQDSSDMSLAKGIRYGEYMCQGDTEACDLSGANRPTALAFLSAARAQQIMHRQRVQRMCICVNCALVDKCTAYHVVEEKHSQPHLTDDPDFTPREGSPTVAINIFLNPELAKKGVEIELDVIKCEDFVLEKGRWVKMMPPGTLVKNGFDPDFIPT